MAQIVEISSISDFIMTLKIRVVNNQSDVNKNNAELNKREKSENTQGKKIETKRNGKK